MKIIDKNISKYVCNYDSGKIIPNIKSLQLGDLDKHLNIFEFGLQVLPSTNNDNFNIACFSCCIGVSSIGLGHIDLRFTVTLTTVNDLDNEKIIYMDRKYIKCYGVEDIYGEYMSFSFDTKKICDTLPENYYRARLYEFCIDFINTNKIRINNISIFEGKV